MKHKSLTDCPVWGTLYADDAGIASRWRLGLKCATRSALLVMKTKTETMWMHVDASGTLRLALSPNSGASSTNAETYLRKSPGGKTRSGCASGGTKVTSTIGQGLWGWRRELSTLGSFIVTRALMGCYTMPPPPQHVLLDCLHPRSSPTTGGA